MNGRQVHLENQAAARWRYVDRQGREDAGRQAECAARGLWDVIGCCSGSAAIPTNFIPDRTAPSMERPANILHHIGRLMMVRDHHHNHLPRGINDER